MKVVGAFEPIEIYQKMPKSIGQHFNVPNKRKGVSIVPRKNFAPVL